MNRRALLLTLAFGLVAAYAGRLAWRAHKNIVTLDVHNVPVQDVVKKIRWQTWESITAHKDLTSRVSLTVEDQPLEGVLGLIAEQCEGRFTIAYPLYTTRAKLALAKKVAAGEVPNPQPGWTNWNSRPNFAAMAARLRAAADGNAPAAPGGDSATAPAGNAPGAGPAGGPPGGGFGGGFGGPGGGFGMMNDGPAVATAVNLEFKGQTPVEAAGELRKFGRVKVVPEDGTFRTVRLAIKDAPMDSAVDQLAKWVNRKWAKLYLIETRGGFRPTPAEREEFAQVPRPDREQMRQRMENFQPTPEMQERATQRVISGIKNSTAEQRAEQRRQRATRGGRGGGGGGRGGR